MENILFLRKIIISQAKLFILGGVRPLHYYAVTNAGPT